MEREIAKQHLDKFPYLSLVWGLVTLFAGSPCGTCVRPVSCHYGWVLLSLRLIISASYLPSHEAQHSIFAYAGQEERWLNELVGHTSPIPLVLPTSCLGQRT